MFTFSQRHHHRPRRRRHVWARRAVTAVLALAALAGGTAAPASATAQHTDPPSSPGSCAEVTVPVTYAGIAASMHGTLCRPPGQEPRTIQLLVHGATYERTYWDLPAPGFTHSPVQDALAAGDATLAVDRIGSGRSTQLPSVALHPGPSAETLHQLITGLRAGTVDGHRYPKIGLVGHSLGAVLAAIETARHNDADALVLTGYGDASPLPGLVTALRRGFGPALLDARFAGRDPGYLSSLSRTGRAQLFHAPDVPAVVTDTDYAHRDIASATELVESVVQGFQPTTIRDIRIPTLVALGERDAIYCGPLAPSCAPQHLRHRLARAFRADNPPQVLITPGAGHDLAMATQRREVNAAITHFIH